MPSQSISVSEEALSLGTVVMVTLCIVAGAICGAHVLRFHIQATKQQRRRGSMLLRDFDSPWMIRMMLAVLLVLWSAGDLIRLPWLRRRLRPTAQAILCEAHVILTLGLTEPALLLAILFLLREALEEAEGLEGTEKRKRRGAGANGRVMLRAAAACLIPLALQVVTAIHIWAALPDSLTRSFFYVSAAAEAEAEAEAEGTLVLCTYPLLSVLAHALFSIAYLACFALLCWRLANGVINRKLRRRICSMLSAVLVLLPLHVAFLAVSSGLHPNRSAAFELLMLLRFLSQLGCFGAPVCVLVVLPVLDAAASGRSTEGTRSCGVILQDVLVAAR